MLRVILAIGTAALSSMACGHVTREVPDQSLGQDPWSRPPPDVVDLLAAWITYAGLADRSALRDLDLPAFTYREVPVDGGPERRIDRMRHILVCEDPRVWAVDGGYDVELRIRTLGTDGWVRSGLRRLEMRVVAGALGIAADVFELEEEREVPTPRHWRHELNCQGVRAYCLQPTSIESPRRRLPYPVRWRSTE